jgi:hypothetical protein
MATITKAQSVAQGIYISRSSLTEESYGVSSLLPASSSDRGTLDKQIEVGRGEIPCASFGPGIATLKASLLGDLLDVLLGSGLDLSGGLGGLDGLTHLDGLAGNALLLADGVLGTAGVALGVELLVADLLGLELVDGFHKDVLVLELVTLASEVELVVDVAVDLLGVTVALEQATEDAGTAHGEDLGGHTGVAGTTAVTGTLVASLALLGLVALYAGARVHVGGLADDDTVLVKLADVLA